MSVSVHASLWNDLQSQFDLALRSASLSSTSSPKFDVQKVKKEFFAQLRQQWTSLCTQQFPNTTTTTSSSSTSSAKKSSSKRKRVDDDSSSPSVGGLDDESHELMQRIQSKNARLAALTSQIISLSASSSSLPSLDSSSVDDDKDSSENDVVSDSSSLISKKRFDSALQIPESESEIVSTLESIENLLTEENLKQNLENICTQLKKRKQTGTEQSEETLEGFVRNQANQMLQQTPIRHSSNTTSATSISSPPASSLSASSSSSSSSAMKERSTTSNSSSASPSDSTPGSASSATSVSASSSASASGSVAPPTEHARGLPKKLLANLRRSSTRSANTLPR